MRKNFTNFKKTKNIPKSAVNSLLKDMKDKVKIDAIVIFTYGKANVDKWYVSNNDGKLSFTHITFKDIDFKTSILESLYDTNVVGVVMNCSTGQKYEKKNADILEVWGYRLFFKDNITHLERVSHHELFENYTTNFKTGKEVAPIEEMVYCGPDGKICGWDKV